MALNMKVTGRTIFKTGGELRPGRMGQSMKVIIKRAKSTDTELTFGLMVLNTLENGMRTK